MSRPQWRRVLVSAESPRRRHGVAATGWGPRRLDLRKTREIKLVDGGVAGLFCIVPVSADDSHPGYLMRADTAASAQEWVAGLNKVRQQELEKSPLEAEGRRAEETVCCCIKRRKPAEKQGLMS